MVSSFSDVSCKSFGFSKFSFSFFNVFGSNPPTLIFSPARRVRDNTVKHTLQNVLEVPEVVINIVDYTIVQQTSLARCEFEKGTNEFEKAGFTALASETIRPKRVAESPVQFECKVNQVIELGTEGGAGNLIICEVVKFHIDYWNRRQKQETTTTTSIQPNV